MKQQAWLPIFFLFHRQRLADSILHKTAARRASNSSLMAFSGPHIPITYAPQKKLKLVIANALVIHRCNSKLQAPRALLKPPLPHTGSSASTDSQSDTTHGHDVTQRSMLYISSSFSALDVSNREHKTPSSKMIRNGPRSQLVQGKKAVIIRS